MRTQLAGVATQPKHALTVAARKAASATSGRIAAFRKALLGWSRRQGRSFPWRSRRATEYQRIISEVLLQRTRADSVAAIFVDFLRRYPSWRALARAEPEELQELLRPLGLWRRRAVAMSQLSRAVMARKGRFPSDRAELETMPGVGQYVASAVLLFCHNKPEALVDTNMARVLERYFGPRTLADIRYDPYLQKLARDVVGPRSPTAVNWAILDLGALICLPRKPRCDVCPLRRGCLALQRQKLC